MFDFNPKQKIKNAFLPASACDEDMRRQIDEIAEAENVSVAEVMRVAVSFFLSAYHQKSMENTPNLVVGRTAKRRKSGK